MISVDSKADYTGGLLPPEFVTFIKVSAILGFIAALALTSALVYKGIKKLVGPEEAKKYRRIIVIADVVILLVFFFIYLIIF
jgi:amino acid transporter